MYWDCAVIDPEVVNNDGSQLKKVYRAG